jgi:hypothetical protein
MDKRYGCEEKDLAHYTCRRTPSKIAIDGLLTKDVWQKAPKSSRFVDMVTGVPAFLDTRIAALWDDENLYIAFWIEEPNVQARFTERDSPVYLEHDVEVFIAGPDCYYEFQINARGTIYEVFYVWQDAYRRGGAFRTPEFDLLGRAVDVIGGFQDSLRYKKHPRGRRWAFMDWDFPGLEAAVRVDGRLNEPATTDRGWTVELAFPWNGMRTLAQGRSLPPKEGDIWRIDFSRFEALQCNGRLVEPSVGWALNRHAVYDSHIPECFSVVHFSRETVKAENA